MKIELRGVTKQYLYGAKVLTSANLTIGDGEIVAVLGQEGSGKTTLLKVIAGVERCDGEVLYDNQPKLLKSDDVIMLFDDGAIFKRLNVFDNLAYSLKIRGENKQAIAEKILRVSDDLNMTALLPLKQSQLTLADRKKVSIARLFLRDSKVILIDDIGAGLDKVEREMLWFDLAKYLKSSGKTVVYTTTQAQEATSISDRIVALHLGEFKQVGSAEEIYNAPQSIWSVEQLDQNFSFGDALLEKTDNKLILNIDGMKLDVSFLKDKLISTEYIGKLVLFGAHCEDFEQNENGIECGVEISFGKSNGEYISYLSNGWRIKSKEKFEGQVKIAPKANKLFLFDKVSENSILK